MRFEWKQYPSLPKVFVPSLSAFALALVTLAISGILAVGTASPAYADEVVGLTLLEERVNATQEEVERTSSEYNEAKARAEEAHKAAKQARAQVAKLEAQIVESQQIIQDVSAKLVVQEERSKDAMRVQYKMEAEGLNLADLLVSSTSVEEFVKNVGYMDHLQELNASELKKYNAMKEEYETALTTAQTAKVEAEKHKQIAENEEASAAEEEARAEKAMEAAKEARIKAQEEAEAEMARREEAMAVAAEMKDDVDWSVGRDDFVEEWAKRIDAYLEGSAMAGCGDAFAEAAWDFGVDPRWSPAVACVESGKGAAVPYYTSNNAWGWMANATNFRTFASFEEGARLHVEYLAHYYGYTVTPEHARTYCPPNAEKWYTAVVNEMRLI